MTALYIILGIIALIVVILSIKVSIDIDFSDDWKITAQWLFIKLKLVPFELKKKAKKEEPKEEPKEEKPEEPKKEKPKKQKSGNNPVKTFYENKGIDGFVELLNNAMSALGGMFGKILRGFIIDELFLNMVVSGDDAADCAIKYGQRCSQIFPALGYICSCMKCRKYNAAINPDFLATKDAIEFSTKISVRPITLTNAVVVLVFKLINKVALKFLMGLKKTKNKGE